MIFKVFDVAQGACSLLISPTGKREMVDFGCSRDWSPFNHVFKNLLGPDQTLHRLVLTHHHGDHLSDIPNLGSRRPELVLRRRFEGQYYEAAKKSNSTEGQRYAEQFAKIFDSWTGEPDKSKVSEEAWGMVFGHYQLSVDEAATVSNSDNSLVNNCSFVRLYKTPCAKILLTGDIEKEGLNLLLKSHRTFATDILGTNILVAPHHGHKTGFSTELFEAMGKPDVVIASIISGDEYVDSRYSSSDFVKGINDGKGGTIRLMTTRKYGAMTIRCNKDGSFQIDCYTR
ncbi:beta-lactamase domain protein [Thermoanaerobacter mathranii subsp. mathranii str. A3]|uniref:Beta-lactamase domain protein n=1 Tax=Thermoanaerobacter mathranii subsp. mathranii (strain DSM 11426 / CCUG 53645 / CIP 108742 / A3) TaxID=583358 RepID=A0ABN3Z385_THEM3|nr:MBL fold metallo-hydrolase [Thermoanaerobacter mathranii]ADH61212.1 beta-lactamase domain protein [Thermoanaerobacter mathranii subsp. mathranii str. A3]